MTKQLLKDLLTFTFILLLFNSFDLPTYISKSRKRYTLRLLRCCCLDVPGEVFFCFLVRHLEWVCRKLLSLVKLYQKVWIWNINQNFCKISKNTFFYRTPPVAASPNRGYLHCAILKAWQDFQEKRALKSRDMQFFLQNIPVEIFKIFKMFENNIKFTRAACWINSKKMHIIFHLKKSPCSQDI